MEDCMGGFGEPNLWFHSTDQSRYMIHFNKIAQMKKEKRIIGKHQNQSEWRNKIGNVHVLIGDKERSENVHFSIVLSRIMKIQQSQKAKFGAREIAQWVWHYPCMKPSLIQSPASVWCHKHW